MNQPTPNMIMKPSPTTTYQTPQIQTSHHATNHSKPAVNVLPNSSQTELTERQEDNEISKIYQQR